MEVAGRKLKAEEENISDEYEFVLCEPCQVENTKTEANGACQECKEYMCTTCFRHHLKGKLCRNHVFLPTGQLSSMSLDSSTENVDTCGHHENEPIKFYCRQHDIVGCGDCMVLAHTACKPEYIKDLAKEFKNGVEFKNLIKKLEMLESCKKGHEMAIEKNQEEIEIMNEKAVKEIRQFRSEINSYFDKIEANTLTEVEKVTTENTEVQRKLEREVKSLTSEIEDVKQKLNTQLHGENILFINAAMCKSKVGDIERMHERIKQEDILKRFQFVRDEKISGILQAASQFGSLRIDSSLTGTGGWQKAKAEDIQDCNGIAGPPGADKKADADAGDGTFQFMGDERCASSKGGFERDFALCGSPPSKETFGQGCEVFGAPPDELGQESVLFAAKSSGGFGREDAQFGYPQSKGLAFVQNEAVFGAQPSEGGYGQVCEVLGAPLSEGGFGQVCKVLGAPLSEDGFEQDSELFGALSSEVGFGQDGALFGAAPSIGGFRQNYTLFGDPPSKGGFEQDDALFGAPPSNDGHRKGAALFGATSSKGGFGKDCARFGVPSSKVGFGQDGALFGAPRSRSSKGGAPFGAPQSKGGHRKDGALFGATSSKVEFGQDGAVFGAQRFRSSKGGALFGAPPSKGGPRKDGVLFGATSSQGGFGKNCALFGVPSSKGGFGQDDALFGAPPSEGGFGKDCALLGPCKSGHRKGGALFGASSSKSGFRQEGALFRSPRSKGGFWKDCS